MTAAASDSEGLDHPEGWQTRITALGIGADRLALVYAGGEMTKAARVWFVIELWRAGADI